MIRTTTTTTTSSSRARCRHHHLRRGDIAGDTKDLVATDGVFDQHVAGNVIQEPPSEGHPGAVGGQRSPGFDGGDGDAAVTQIDPQAGESPHGVEGEDRWVRHVETRAVEDLEHDLRRTLDSTEGGWWGVSEVRGGA